MKETALLYSSNVEARLQRWCRESFLVDAVVFHKHKHYYSSAVTRSEHEGRSAAKRVNVQLSGEGWQRRDDLSVVVPMSINWCIKPAQLCHVEVEVGVFWECT